MHVIRRVMILGMLGLGAALFSQAPELTQQYRQRLGGAIDELTLIIQNFDEQANHNGLDRQAALNIYARSSEDFLRSQGASMRDAFERYEHLYRQQSELNAASPIVRPMLVMQHMDSAILASAWRDFVPGVPISAAGLVWGGIGAFFALVVSIPVGAMARRARVFTRGSRRGRSSSVSGNAYR
jgi:hypothetical protein